MYVHPLFGPSKLSITQDLFEGCPDSNSPSVFWQSTCPTTIATKVAENVIRVLGMRMSVGKAAALGVERLWFKARWKLADNRR